MKELKVNTRFQRFSNGYVDQSNGCHLQVSYSRRSAERTIPLLTEEINRKYISEKGLKLAREEPYIVWNDSKREVVISTPEHMKDFFSGDTKGKYVSQKKRKKKACFNSGVNLLEIDHAKPPDYNMGYYFTK